ncbi:MAG: 50S ribosomal protein L11 methyltransferase [Alphaproteobacteria bacterium]|nr:50S ribosomal protein L11 methyltransferase [Alphaproteobacteria bacterium]
MNNPAPGPTEGLFSVTLTLPAGLDETQAGCFLACADDDALASSLVRDMKQGGQWTVQWITTIHPTRMDLGIRKDLAVVMAGLDSDFGKDLVWEILPIDPETNWLELNYKALPAFNIGDFYIYGSHHDGSIPAGQIGLLIDAATAFGSGEHGTTAGCLEALLMLRDAGGTPSSILDVGTGSGILAIAARKLWPVPTVATDNDPEAVRVAAVHASANNLAEGDISFICAEGFDDPAVAAPGPYPLVIANILAAPLKMMAAQLCAATAPGGTIILSGILAEGQADEVQAVYEQNGADAQDRLIRGEWATLILRK